MFRLLPAVQAAKVNKPVEDREVLLFFIISYRINTFRKQAMYIDLLLVVPYWLG
jgi:hypothetical protein